MMQWPVSKIIPLYSWCVCVYGTIPRLIWCLHMQVMTDKPFKVVSQNKKERKYNAAGQHPVTFTGQWGGTLSGYFALWLWSLFSKIIPSFCSVFCCLTLVPLVWFSLSGAWPPPVSMVSAHLRCLGSAAHLLHVTSNHCGSKKEQERKKRKKRKEKRQHLLSWLSTVVFLFYFAQCSLDISIAVDLRLIFFMLLFFCCVVKLPSSSQLCFYLHHPPHPSLFLQPFMLYNKHSYDSDLHRIVSLLFIEQPLPLTV